MAKIIFIAHDGTRREVPGIDGESLMEAAVGHRVPGIDADCGGWCACATCHVYVEPEWEAKTGTRTAMEEDMLNFAAVTQANSRLACQIPVTEALDGLVVRMPEGQH